MILRLILIVPFYIIAIITDVFYIRKNIERVEKIKPFRLNVKEQSGSLVSSAVYSMFFCAILLPPILELMPDNIYILILAGILSLVILYYFIEIIRHVIIRLIIKDI
ncbi:MAG: hypothetical protein M0P32_04415 [Bacteroidales bacterium]|nr:hypothetical protein [Bacteroidales bacterium]